MFYSLPIGTRTDPMDPVERSCTTIRSSPTDPLESISRSRTNPSRNVSRSLSSVRLMRMVS